MADFVRVRSYLQTGEFTSCEHIYFNRSQSEALTKFKEEYPEHNDCILVAEYYDPEQNKEHFTACLRCGCVH